MTVTRTFNFTGAWQTYTIPNNITSVTVDVKGAGNTGSVRGGRVTGTIAVSPGQVLYIVVGEASNAGAQGTYHSQSGGGTAFGAGGPGGAGYNAHGGNSGAGYSAIRIGSTGGTLKCVAGGAGGNSGDGGMGGPGGSGTGGTGGRGNAGGNAATGGTGGTQSTGGHGGTSSSGTGFYGTDAADTAVALGGTGGDTGGLDGPGGGGGGGGYRSGGGGAGGSTGWAPGTGGGGGSNYTGGLGSAGSSQGGGNTGHGSVVISHADPNVAPNTPTSLSPAAGAYTRSAGTQVVSATVSDPDGGTVRALFRVSTDPNFGSYSNYYSGYVNSGQTASYTLTGLQQNAHYYVRVYAQDPEGLYSGYASTNFYTNRTPNAPTLDGPTEGASFAKSATQEFSWTFSDPDAGDSQSYAYFYWVRVGDVNWTLVEVPGATASWTSSANFFEAGVDYAWCVQTRDAGGLWSEVSAVRTFHVTGPAYPPEWVSPTDEAVYKFDQDIPLEWTFEDPDVGDSQTRADLRYSEAGLDSWTEIDSITTTALTYNLPDGTLAANKRYELQVRTWDTTNQVSGWSLSQHVKIYDNPPAPTGLTPENLSIQNTNTPNLTATRAASVDWQRCKMQWIIASDSGFTANVKTITQDDSKLSSSNTSQSEVLAEASKLDQSHTWYIKVRQVDEYGNYSSYTASKTFNVSHPPSVTSLSPSSSQYLATSAATRLSWAFSDTSVGDAQTAFQVIVERNDTGASVYDSTKTTSTDHFEDVDFTAAPKDVLLRWKVRVWDTDDVVGSYSSYALIYIGDPPTFTITPANNAIVDTGAPVVDWSDLTLGGTRYQTNWSVVFRHATDSSLVHSASGTTPSTRSYDPVQTILLNSQDYTVTVTVTDSVGLSASVTSFFHTEYDSPDVVHYSVDLSVINTEGFIRVDWAASQADAALAAWRVYRRVYGETVWTLLEEIPNQNTREYHDWLIEASTNYQYTVTQVADRYGQLLESPIGFDATYIVSRQNLIRNPTLLVDASFWEGVPGTDGAGGAVTRETSGGAVSGTFARFTWTNGTSAVSGGIEQATDAASVAENDIITASCYVRPSKDQRLVAKIEWMNAADAVISSVTGDEAVADNATHTQYFVSGIAPANTDYVRLSVVAVAGTGGVNWAIADYIDADGWLVGKTDQEWDFFSGSTPGASWDGDIGLSTSTQDQVWTDETGVYSAEIDQYWIIDTEEESLNVMLTNVINAPFAENYEEATYTLIGRGRKKDYGTRLGYSGTIDCQFRGYDGSPRLAREKLEALRYAQDTYYLRSPFGDLFKIAIGDINFTPLAGTGRVDMYDVSIPFEEVS